MKDNEIMDHITKEFKGLEFERAEYNDTYGDFEFHFKGGKYFCLGSYLKASFRQVIIYGGEKQ